MSDFSHENKFYAKVIEQQHRKCGVFEVNCKNIGTSLSTKESQYLFTQNVKSKTLEVNLFCSVPLKKFSGKGFKEKILKFS